MKTTILTSLIMLGLCGQVAAAEAWEGNIQFAGSITTSTCRLEGNNADSHNIYVNMGAVAADQVGTVSNPIFSANSLTRVTFRCKPSYEGWTPCSSDKPPTGATLSPDCPTGTYSWWITEYRGRSLDIKLVANPADLAESGFALKVTAGGANVGISLYGINNKSAWSFSGAADLMYHSVAISDIDGAGTFSFRTAYVQLNGEPVTPGVANASLPLLMNHF